MLVTFKSKAAAEIIMYEEHAKRLLDLLGKDVKQGIITASQTDDAIEKIEAEIAAERARRAEQEARQKEENQPAAGHDEDKETQVTEPIGLATRAYPLLEMLRAAQAKKQDVVWGV